MSYNKDHLMVTGSKTMFHLHLISNILQIFNNELFGAVAEEKEVKGIVSKLMEARHSKSLDSYEVLAQFCSKESITKLILPLKEVSKNWILSKNKTNTCIFTLESMCINTTINAHTSLN